MQERFGLETTIPKLYNTPASLSIVDKARNFHERMFHEAWYSQRDSYVGNEHIDIADVYKSLA